MSRDLTDYRHSFAMELRKALTARGTTSRALATSIGVSARQAWFWTDGRSLPYLVTARKIAEALEWEQLGQIVRLARTVKCAACGRKVVTETSAAQRLYCDEACRQLANKIGKVKPQPTRTDRRLTMYADSVDAMCAGCEPEGVCHDGSCPLRSVSPLPLRVGLNFTPLPIEGRKSRWDHPEQRAKASEAMKAVWASRSASQRRTNTAAANRKRWASYTPEERAAVGRRVSEGLQRARANGEVIGSPHR